MKKTLAFLLLLTLTLGMVGTALAEETGTLPWRGYALEATWLSTNRADINIPNLRSDGHFALVRLAPMEGTIDYDVINEHAGNDIFLRLANGKKIPLASVLYHKLITPKGGGFPTIDPKQDNFDALFFLVGGSETDLLGAELVIVDGSTEHTIALEAISREKPDA